MPESEMKVAFDATPVITGSTGIARYVTQLVAGLERTGVDVGCYALGRAALSAPDGVRHMRIPLRVIHALWHTVGRPRAEWLVPGADLVHASSLEAPPTRLPVVATVHDMAALEHPDLHPRRAVKHAKEQLRSLERASVIVADSRATAASLRRRGVEAARIVVIWPGVTALPPAIRPLSVPSGPYLLGVGQLMGRKGFSVLLDALAGVAPEVSLVLAGPDGPAAAALRERANRPDLAGRVHFAGAVTDSALAWLYGNAVALCFPSVAEGFGLPVVEAMAAGLPVVASDIDVLHEVAGPAARYVTQGDAAAWGAALEDIVCDEATRSDLVAAGLVRAALFSWDAAALGTIAAYEMAMSSG